MPAHDTDPTRPVVGFIGLGDQGLPMATAIGDAGYELHVWARRPASLAALGDHAHVAHDTAEQLARVCDVVALCVGTDDDVRGLVTGSLLGRLRPGSVIVNHGTGTPGTAVELAARCAEVDVAMLDAPVSGGRPAAQARELTTMVGGSAAALQRCEGLFETFSAHVVHLGGPGAGQSAKLCNNALLMLNQAAIAEIVDVGEQLGVTPARLVEVLGLGSGASTALALLNTMITTATVEHLAEVLLVDLDVFTAATSAAGIAADAVTARARRGAEQLPDLIGKLGAPATGHARTTR